MIREDGASDKQCNATTDVKRDTLIWADRQAQTADSRQTERPNHEQSDGQTNRQTATDNRTQTQADASRDRHNVDRYTHADTDSQRQAQINTAEHKQKQTVTDSHRQT